MMAIRRFLAHYERLLLMIRLSCAAILPVFAYNGQSHTPDPLMLTAFFYYLLSGLYLSLYGRNQEEKNWRPWHVFLVLDLLLVTCMVRDQGGLQSDIYYYYYGTMAMSAFLFKWRSSLAVTLLGHLLYWIAVLTVPETLDERTLLLRACVFLLTSMTFPLLSYMEQARLRMVEEANRYLAEKTRLLAEMEAYNQQVAEYTMNLHNQAVLDPLTQLHNPTYFHTRIIIEIEKSKQSGRPLSLLLLDIDNFKRVNDTYGHLIGDEVLIAIARQMRDMLGDTFYVPSRLGGEELAVLMPDTGLESAYDLAEKLRQSVAQVVVLLPEGRPLHVTCSVGVATYPQMCDSHQQLVDCADQAMYIAKSSGKNRTCLFHSKGSAS